MFAGCCIAAHGHSATSGQPVELIEVVTTDACAGPVVMLGKQPPHLLPELGYSRCCCPISATV